MRKIILIAATICGILPARLSAQASSAPTWSSDVACIVYSHCTSCHNSTGIAPFSLVSYSDAYLNMQSMKYDVSIKKMPPYLPNTSYQKYADMHRLTDQEIKTISDWVVAGGPQGDSTLAPPPPVYTTNVVITNPDVTARIPDYTVPFTGNDLYRCFVLTAPADSDHFIKSIEVIPGDRSAVHHVLVFTDTSSTPVTLDNGDPNPGYTNFGGTGSNTSKLIDGWVPGSGAYTTPTGMGIKVVKNSRIIIQIHYPTSAVGKLDSTRVNIQYIHGNTAGIRNVSLAPILNHQTDLTDGPLVIPADSIKTFHEQFTVPANVTVLGIAPHAHLVCRQMKAFAVTTVGDTIPLVEIDNWDFHWQGTHSFQKPIKIPTGSVLHGIALYDNTYNNPNGPRPIQTVTVGESTTNEMMLFYFSYLLYQSGDENIIIDTASHEAHYLNCVSAYVGADSTATGISVVGADAATYIMIYPNPAQNVLNYESADEVKDISITDVTGQTVRQLSAPDMTGQIAIDDMSSGLYFIRVQNQNGSVYTERFVKE